MSIHESGEMYLKTIYILSQQKSEVRAIDVATQLGYSKPSVSRALSILKRNGYVTVEPSGHLVLTKSGQKIAQTIHTRRVVLTQILMRLGVDEKTAEEDACRMEHVISDKSFAAVQHYLEQTEGDCGEKT